MAVAAHTLRVHTSAACGDGDSALPADMGARPAAVTRHSRLSGVAVAVTWAVVSLLLRPAAPCPAGNTVDPAGTLQDCIVCPAGKFKAETGHGPCKDCAAGKYNAKYGATHCEHCPHHSSSASASRSPSSCLCSMGYTGAIASDVQRLAHLYSNFSNNSSQIGIHNVSYLESWAPFPVLSGSCDACVEGKFKATNGSAACQDCGAGQYSAVAGSAICVPCPRGTYSASYGSTHCVSCPAGKFKAEAGRHNCTNCPAGKFSTSPALLGSVNASASRASCALCAAGKYSNETGATNVSVCKECSAHSHSSAGSNSCIPCPAFSQAPRGSGEITDCSCQQGYTGPDGNTCAACSPGKFKSTNGSAACGRCDMGTYSLEGKSACTTCPLGTVSGFGSTSESMCTHDAVEVVVTSKIEANLSTFQLLQHSILISSARMLGLHQSAVEIVPQSVREFPKATEGILRRLFTSSSDQNVTVFDLHVTVPGAAVEETIRLLQQNLTHYLAASGLPSTTVMGIKRGCGAGRTQIGMLCSDCAHGFYKTAADNSSCLPCPLHSNTAGRKTFLVEQCACNAGFYSTGKLHANASCLECGLGYFCTGNQSRSPCAEGTYGNETMLASPSSCQPCPPNTSSFTSSFEKANCTLCDKGYEGSAGANFTGCKACAAGFYKAVVADGLNCTSCLAGTYLNKTASRRNECVSCPSGSSSRRASPLVTNCSCNHGYTGPDGAECSACAAGKFKDRSGPSMCENCVAGKYALQAASLCTMCPNNTFSAAVAAPSLDACQSCPQFSLSQEGSENLHDCICFAGRYLLGTECVACSRCNPAKSMYSSDRPTCLPCSGQENQDMYAGTGVFKEDTCQSSDIKYAYEYVLKQQELKLQWFANWTSLYPWVPRPSNANKAIVFQSGCESTCNAGFKWLNHSDWYQKCIQQVNKTSNGLTVGHCNASVFSPLDVLVFSSSSSFQREGVPISPGQFLGTRYHQFAFGGCWPCNHIHCPEGYGSVRPCVLQKTGTRNSTLDDSYCGACPPGTYSDVVGMGSCSLCGAGKYNSLFAAAQCTKCPNHSDSLPGAQTASMCTCNAGYTGRIVSDSGLISTVENHLRTMSLSEWRLEGLKNRIQKEASGSFRQCKVNATKGSGFYGGNSTDLNLSNHSNSSMFLTGENGNNQTCNSVAMTSHAVRSHGLTDKTVNGSIILRGIDYPNVTYIESWAPGPTNFSGACIACRPGSYKEATGSAPCTLCAIGKYSEATAAVSVSSCQYCPANSNSPKGTGNVTGCICNAGFAKDHGGDCVGCDPGTFKRANGSSPCVPCQIGKYADVVGATTCSLCPAGKLSAPGSVSTSDCQACISGKYEVFSLEANIKYCLPCEQGKFSTRIAVTSCSMCPPNSDSLPGAQTASMCTCNAGYTGAISSDLEELTRLHDNFSNASLSTNTSYNLSYLESWALSPSIPWIGTFSGVCRPCLAGFSKPLNGSAACTECKAGKFSAINGSSECAACDAGTFSSSNGTTTCTACEAGKFSHAMSASTSATCIDCGANKSSPAGSNHSALCV